MDITYCVFEIAQWKHNNFTTRNVVHFDHIFAITMQLMSKPTDFMTSNVLVLYVYVVATCCSHI
jgi:hypothetical protein